MKNFTCLAVLFLIAITSVFGSDNFTVNLAREFSKDLFEYNGVNFLQPVVKVTNGTSNTRFFSDAYVPAKVDKPYFRFGIQSMLGFVDKSLKTYNPVMPTEKFDYSKMSQYFTYDMALKKITRLDTAGLVHYLFLNLMYEGIYGSNKGAIKVPTNVSTALGKGNSAFVLPHDTLIKLLQNHPLYSSSLIPQNIKDSIANYIYRFPETFTLYGGADLSTIAAGIPQLEIGALWGTELLLRYIPPMDLGSTIGDFTFYGVGIKHSISQYFNDPGFNMAVQVVYQGTGLKNKIGITQADLNAHATMYNFNIEASKSIKDWFDIYTGCSYETININSTYSFLLPIETQWQLGLLEKDHYEPTPGYPGDHNPQKVKVSVSDNNFKWTVGVMKKLGNFRIYADYNVSKFNIFSAGIDYTFDINL